MRTRLESFITPPCVPPCEGNVIELSCFKTLSVHNYNKREFINDSQGNPKVKSTSYSPNRAVIR